MARNATAWQPSMFWGGAAACFFRAKQSADSVNPHNRHDDSFVGLIDHFPASAQRGPGEMDSTQG